MWSSYFVPVNLIASLVFPFTVRIVEIQKFRFEVQPSDRFAWAKLSSCSYTEISPEYFSPYLVGIIAGDDFSLTDGVYAVTTASVLFYGLP